MFPDSIPFLLNSIALLFLLVVAFALLMANQLKWKMQTAILLSLSALGLPYICLVTPMIASKIL